MLLVQCRSITGPAAIPCCGVSSVTVLRCPGSTQLRKPLHLNSAAANDHAECAFVTIQRVSQARFLAATALRPNSLRRAPRTLFVLHVALISAYCSVLSENVPRCEVLKTYKKSRGPFIPTLRAVPTPTNWVPRVDCARSFDKPKSDRHDPRLPEI